VSGDRVYHGAIRAFSVLFMAIGAVLIVATLVDGGGPASVGFLMGILFVAIGAGRLWVSSRMGG
jgi:hypothetical protein